jgi:hypothetical protein
MEEEELLRAIMVHTFSFHAHTRYGAHSRHRNEAGGGTATAENNYGIACRIGHVFDELDIDVL